MVTAAKELDSPVIIRTSASSTVKQLGCDQYFGNF